MRQFFGAIFLKFKRLASIFLLMIKPYDISSYDKIIKNNHEITYYYLLYFRKLIQYKLILLFFSKHCSEYYF
jgi:hypothetical protein